MPTFESYPTYQYPTHLPDPHFAPSLNPYFSLNPYPLQPSTLTPHFHLSHLQSHTTVSLRLLRAYHTLATKTLSSLIIEEEILHEKMRCMGEDFVTKTGVDYAHPGFVYPQRGCREVGGMCTSEYDGRGVNDLDGTDAYLEEDVYALEADDEAFFNAMINAD